MSMMISTKENDNAGFDPFDVRLIYDTPRERYLVDCLTKEFERYSSIKPLISALSETDSLQQLIVIVDHANGSLLLDLDERKFEVLKSIFSQAKGVLWITFDVSGNGKNAGAGAVSGILRTLRLENGSTNYVTCDVEAENLSQPELARTIFKVFAKTFSKSNMNSLVKDLEFAVQNGRILIPRLVEDKRANEATTTQLAKREPEEESLWQEDSCLCLDMAHIGLLDTFQFVRSEKCSSAIQRDEVEIEVKTVGLNFRDLMVATGQLPDLNGYGFECAGIITKIGKTTHHFQVGDRVCAVAHSSFSNRVRTSQTLVSIIPDSMSFETAASIPCVFTTAHYCIHHSARLQKNESILIHSAAGGTGQALIKMAQLIGAQVFVTAGSPAKAEFLEKSFGLPRSQIFNSRNLNFAHQIMSLTEGKGVDVIVNSLAGDYLRESWRCLAMFGRFIELGKRDAIDNARLDMANFERSTSYISVGWNYFIDLRPELVGSLLKDVMRLFANGTLTPLEPITTFPMSAVESAFRFMASGNHMGKIVVTADRDCLVKVRRPRDHSLCC